MFKKKFSSMLLSAVFAALVASPAMAAPQSITVDSDSDCMDGVVDNTIDSVPFTVWVKEFELMNPVFIVTESNNSVINIDFTYIGECVALKGNSSSQIYHEYEVCAAMYPNPKNDKPQPFTVTVLDNLGSGLENIGSDSFRWLGGEPGCP